MIKNCHLRFWLLIGLVCFAPVRGHSIQIEFRYDYDSRGFFDQPGAKEALRAVAGFYESLFKDELLPIDPAIHGGSWNARIVDVESPFSGSILNIHNLVVPENTVVIFVGAGDFASGAVSGPGGYQNLGGTPDWSERLMARGQAGALASPPTDFGPWGGMISFSAQAVWDFSLTSNNPSVASFASAAMHEIAHVLGFGTSPSWNALHDGVGFYGANAMASYGGPVPLETSDPRRAHWREDHGCAFPDGYTPGNPNNVLSLTVEAFGTPHGFDQIALMDLLTCIAGEHIKVLTDLDVAALVDVGWEINKHPRLNISGPDAGSDAFVLSWASSSMFQYRIEFSESLSGGDWETVHERTGNGALQSYEAAMAAASGRGFFRMGVEPVGVASALGEGDVTVSVGVAPAAAVKATHDDPVLVTSCTCDGGHSEE